MISPDGTMTSWTKCIHANPHLVKPNIKLGADMTDIEAMYTDSDNLYIVYKWTVVKLHKAFLSQQPMKLPVIKLDHFKTQFGEELGTILASSELISGMYGRNSTQVSRHEFILKDKTQKIVRLVIDDKRTLLVNQPFALSNAIPIYRSLTGEVDNPLGDNSYTILLRNKNDKNGYVWKTEFHKESDFDLVKNDEIRPQLHLTNRLVGCPDSFCFGAEFDGVTNYQKQLMIFNGRHVFLVKDFGKNAVFSTGKKFEEYFSVGNKLNGYVDDAVTIKHARFFKGKETIIIFETNSVYFYDASGVPPFNLIRVIDIGRYFLPSISQVEAVVVGPGGARHKGTTKNDLLLIFMIQDEIHYYKMVNETNTQFLHELEYTKIWPHLPDHAQSAHLDDKRNAWFFIDGYYYRSNADTLKMFEIAKPVAGNLIKCTDQGYRNLGLQEHGISDYKSFLKHLNETALPKAIGGSLAKDPTDEGKIPVGKLIGIIAGGVCLVIFVIVIAVFTGKAILSNRKKSQNSSGSLEHSDAKPY